MEEQQNVEEDKAVETKLDRVADQQRQRRLQGLTMQRERILSERTSNPHRRGALVDALAAIERELEQLGWTIHL